MPACLHTATEKNLDDIRCLIHHTIIRCYPKVYPQGVVDYFLTYHNDSFILKNLSEGITLLLFAEDQPVATGYLHKNTVGGMYVHPDFQGRGYGKTVLQALLALARKKKIKKVVLDATLLAEKFYRKAGFKTIDFVYQEMPNGDRLYYFKMSKDLSPSKKRKKKS
jgi:GNAT superfamily N-acetyltransferase